VVLQSVFSAGMNPREGAFVQDATCQPDPCLTQPFSMLRFAVLALLFITMFSTAILLILLEDRPYHWISLDHEGANSDSPSMIVIIDTIGACGAYEPG
jgi:hypothetical protein